MLPFSTRMRLFVVTLSAVSAGIAAVGMPGSWSDILAPAASATKAYAVEPDISVRVAEARAQGSDSLKRYGPMKVPAGRPTTATSRAPALDRQDPATATTGGN